MLRLFLKYESISLSLCEIKKLFSVKILLEFIDANLPKPYLF